MKIKQESYKRAVRKYARRSEEEFKKLNAFAKKAKLSDEMFDQLCDIIDNGYIKLNRDIRMFCERNEIDESDCFCDITNNSAARVDKWA